MDKVLVIMATYNGAQYLQEQIDSIFYQENVEVNVLIRDDGSSDGTKEILKKNSLRKGFDWYEGKHLNIQLGYFELMEKAKNYDIEYIAFSDQDDVWDKNKLKIGIDKIKKFKTPALYYAGQRLVNHNLHFIENHILNKKRSLKTRFVISDFAGCTGVMNKKLLIEAIKYKPKYMLMHDAWVFRVCICLGGKVVIDSEAHMDYRQHKKNVLGLGHSLRATIKQVNQYLNKYHIEKLTKELVKGYGDSMIPEYLEISHWICEYKENIVYKKNLLKKENVNFYNVGLNFTYWLKVVLNKL